MKAEAMARPAITWMKASREDSDSEEAKKLL